MPSALTPATGLLGRMASVLGGKLGGKDSPQNSSDRIKRLGLSQRQQDLNRLWAVYRCMQYAHRKLDWNGRENVDELSSEVISSQGYVPPGFVDMSKASNPLPLKFRRPTAPYALIKLIVDRFTGLLFSENQHPEIKVEGDPKTEDWLRAVADAARMWAVMILARTYGGAQGTAVVGFQFNNGKPVVEVHDPRWLTPEFQEHGSNVLIRLEKRYTYPKEVRDEATGRWETKEFWYRRVIDQTSDVLYEPAEVGNGEEPQWSEAKRADHNFGFVPVLWVQNLPVQDSEDGDPDCPVPVYENAQAIDALIAQANRAIIANCDPQLVVTTKAEMADVRLSGDSALRIPDGTAEFLEVQATGPKAALELAESLRKHALEMSSCVLEAPDSTDATAKTATEVDRNYQSMWAKTDVMREQYGQGLIIPLLEMMYQAAVQLGKPVAIPQEQAPQETQPDMMTEQVQQEAPEASGGAAPQVAEADGQVMQRPTVVRQQVVVPPKYTVNDDGTVAEEEREPGTGGTITLKWPGYTQPTLDDVVKAATAATAALQGTVIDDETAVHFVAPYFKVEDKTDLLKKVRANAAQQQSDLMAQMASSTNPKPSDATAPPGGILPHAPTS